jgi:hypothetical protein
MIKLAVDMQKHVLLFHVEKDFAKKVEEGHEIELWIYGNKEERLYNEKRHTWNFEVSSWLRF